MTSNLYKTMNLNYHVDVSTTENNCMVIVICFVSQKYNTKNGRQIILLQ